MAEKKYIGKPGKQDDPCWKGYEMVGMKKKNGRKVPNCVPEAREIIEKAKAKLKKDPLTGAKIDKDRFILPEENELDEALTRVTSGNKGYGYHGNVEARDEEERDKRYSAMHRHAKNLLMSKGHLQDAKKPNVMVKHFLDSTHGRHIAHSPTEKEITSRFAHFKKSYDPKMHEEVELEEGYGVKAHSFSSFKDGVQDWADNHTHNGKVDVKTRVVNAGGKSWHQTTASHKGVIVGTFNHTGNGKSEEGHGRHAHWSDNVHEELEEAYGMWKVDFPKQHAGKAVAAGSVYVKAQNTAHAHKVAAKRVGVDHKMFKSKVTKSSILPENKDLPWEEDPKNPTRKVGERKDQYGNKIKNVAKHLVKKAMKTNEDVELDEGIQNMSDARLKYHATRDFPHGSYTSKEIKSEHERRRKTVPNYHKVKPSLSEELEQIDEISYETKTRFMKKAKDFVVKNGKSKKTAKLANAVVKLDNKHPWMHMDADNVKEELGKDNEWGRPELRKKFAAMTPGQEGLAADKIPTFDPRYDDVTTQHLGLHPMKEGFLAEISARGAEARAKFQARVHKVLNDPASIKRAKKSLAKKAKLEKEKEPPHLVMQLRKAVSIGSKVHFRDGSHHTIAPNHADRFMSKYNSAKSAIEKEALQKRAHASHSEFMKTIAEEVHENCGTPDCCMQCDTAAMGTHHVDSYEAHKGSGDQISPVISHDDEDIRFSDFDETEFEKELEADVLALSWDDLVDLYDDDELEYVDAPEKEEGEEDEDESEDMQEAITPAGRLKKKFAAMRTKTRRNMARNLALKRVSTPDRIKSRSIRAARRMVYKRLLRNRDISTVSAAEKTRLEAQVKRMAPMVARLSVRIMPKVRKLEQSRIQHGRARKK